jgi:trehalose synthase-fused probable maltokinase
VNRTDLSVWLDERLPRMLPDYLPQRRWFGGKSRPIADVTLEDVAWLPADRRPCALVLVRVRDSTDEESRYALVIVFDRDAGTLPVVGRVESQEETAVALEGAADPSTVMALLHGFASNGRRELATLRGGTLRYGDGEGLTARVLSAAAHVRQVGAEQSNTSLCIDRTLAFKLFRRVEAGENPELEIGRFLATRTDFRSVPLLRGSLTYVPARGEPATVGILQDWVESQGDGWAHMVALLRRHGDELALESVRADAFSLGVLTERLHRALASDYGDTAFAPEPATFEDVVAWRNNVVERARRTTRLIERQISAWSLPARRLGEDFIKHYRHYGIMSAVPDSPQAPFRKIRVHGDYHLGQTLKTTGGFVVIDFEGEPSRPLTDRRAKQAALKDVAGMLRSFDYAAQTALPEAGDEDGNASIAHVLRERFLNGYRATFSDRTPEFAPADPSAVSAWIDFFELEKALYEVEYEINNRPDWVAIPLSGLMRIVRGRIGLS